MYANTGTPAGAGTGQRVQLGAAMPDESPVTVARSRVEEAQKRIIALHGDVRVVADEVFGAWPQGTEGESDQPLRMGQFGALHDDLDRLHVCISALSEQVGRLRSLGLSNNPRVML